MNENVLHSPDEVAKARQAKRRIRACQAAYAVLAAGAVTVFWSAACVWSRYYRRNEIMVEPAPDDAGPAYTLSFFPVVEDASGIAVATSYAESLGGIGYNRLRTDSSRTRGLPVCWCFRRTPNAVRYGFVVRRRIPPTPPRRRGGRFEGGWRVYWITPDELDAAINRGGVRVRKFADLPTFDSTLAAQMLLVGDDLVPVTVHQGHD